MIRNVLLDLDDTLFDFGKCERMALIETFTEIGIKPSEKIVSEYSEINDMYWKRLERKEVTRQQVLTGRFQTLFSKFGIFFSGEEANEIYKNKLGEQSFFIDGAIDLLNELQKDYDLYIVSNGTATVQDSRIERAKIAKYFKKIFISERMGVNKPDSLFFQKCFEHIRNFKKEETVIIGDSLSSDIKGGENAGIRAIWYNPKALENHTGIGVWKEVKELAEMPDILRKTR